MRCWRFRAEKESNDLQLIFGPFRGAPLVPSKSVSFIQQAFLTPGIRLRPAVVSPRVSMDSQRGPTAPEFKSPCPKLLQSRFPARLSIWRKRYGHKAPRPLQPQDDLYVRATHWPANGHVVVSRDVK